MTHRNNRVWPLVLAIILLLAAIWTVYGQVANFGVMTPDDMVIAAFPSTNPEGFRRVVAAPWKIFTLEMPPNCPVWMPLIGYSILFDMLVLGFSAADYGGFHLVNVWMHCLNVILFLLLLFHITRRFWPSLAVAFIFALHPLNVETVVQLTNRAVLLSNMFWLLLLVAYVHHARQPSFGRYGLIVFFFFLGLMSKPAIAPYVCLLPCLDFWPLGRYPGQKDGSQTTLAAGADFPERTWRQLILEKIPLFLIAGGWVLFCIIFYLGTPYYDTVGFPAFGWPQLLKLLSFPISYLVYLFKILLPLDLNYFYSVIPKQYGPLSISLALAAVVGISLAVVKAAGRYPYLAAGWFWYLLCITPAAMVNAVVQRHIILRYAYFPTIGLIIMVVWFTADLSGKHNIWKKRLLPLLAAILVVVLGIISFRLASHWQSRETLYRQALKIAPDQPGLHVGLAVELDQIQKKDQAIAHLQQALRLDPDRADAHQSLGRLFHERQRFAAATRHLEKAIAEDPDDIKSKKMLVDTYVQQGQPERAIGLLKSMLTAHPAYRATICFNLGYLYVTLNDLEQAAVWFIKSMQHDRSLAAEIRTYPFYEQLQQTPAFRRFLKGTHGDHAATKTDEPLE